MAHQRFRRFNTGRSGSLFCESSGFVESVDLAESVEFVELEEVDG